jgi:hypothetical protein
MRLFGMARLAGAVVENDRHGYTLLTKTDGRPQLGPPSARFQAVSAES